MKDIEAKAKLDADAYETHQAKIKTNSDKKLKELNDLMDNNKEADETFKADVAK